MIYEPVEDHLLVRKIEEAEEVSEGGIIKPDIARRPGRDAEVVAVGPGRRTDYGKLIETMVKPGDRIMIRKGTGQGVKHRGDDMLIIRACDVIAKVHEG